MFCNCLVCLKRKTKLNNFLQSFFISSFWITWFFVVFWTNAKRLVLNRLLGSCYNFVEKYTKLRNVSEAFNVITETFWTRFVQTEYNSCKIFCKSDLFCENFARFKHILQDLARLCVAAHLRGMRPTFTTKKDTLMLREKLKHYTISTRL